MFHVICFNICIKIFPYSFYIVALYLFLSLFGSEPCMCFLVVICAAYCETCIPIPEDEIIICPICEVPHPSDFPEVCLELHKFLEETFPKEYASRRNSIEHERADFKQKSSPTCMFNSEINFTLKSFLYPLCACFLIIFLCKLFFFSPMARVERMEDIRGLWRITKELLLSTYTYPSACLVSKLIVYWLISLKNDKKN